MAAARIPHGLFYHQARYYLPAALCLMLSAALYEVLLVPDAYAADIKLKADPDNAEQVKRGEFIYNRFCALCHGRDLKGQPNWRRRKENGRLPAPPHDETGHTWHHDDDLLFGITKFGLVPPYAPKNYKSDMPAWQSTLKDDDIWAVLAYIKSRWPAETRQTSKEINAEAQKQMSGAGFGKP